MDSLFSRSDLTPLHCAAGCGHLDVVQALVTAGASVNLTGRGRRTAIFMAAENGHLDCVLPLLQVDADISVTSVKGWWLSGLFADVAPCSC